MRSTRIIAIISLLFAGCASAPVNPSFDVSIPEASNVLRRLSRDRRPLSRPLVIVGGFNDPGIGPAVLEWRLREFVDDDRICGIQVFSGSNFADCRRQLLDAIEKRFPGEKVDVIGLSMGGLVARYAGVEIDGTQLRIVNLFTISSPHQGAKLARIASLDQKVLEMRPGSPFLKDLASHDASATYQIYCYTRLDDDIVGAEFASPPGRTAWWVSNPPLQSAHLGAATDDRILADILLRLRQEPPLTTDPPAPLPAHH